jgi:hypothetical protein
MRTAPTSAAVTGQDCRRSRGRALRLHLRGSSDQCSRTRTAATRSPVPAMCWPWCPSSRVQRHGRVIVREISSAHSNRHSRYPVVVPGSVVGSGSPTTTRSSLSLPSLRNVHRTSMSASRCGASVSNILREQIYFKSQNRRTVRLRHGSTGKLICNFICSARPHTQVQLHMCSLAHPCRIAPRAPTPGGTESKVQAARGRPLEAAHGA